MAFNNKQSDIPLPVKQNEKRTSTEFLPKYFRTSVNKKILAATLDQLISPGAIEKVNGFYGRRNSKAHNVNDNYIPDVSLNRENYQFEPTLVIKDDLDNVTFYKEYRDIINQIANFNGDNRNHSTLFSQEYYAWNPHIDWDKFVNFREYYWLPNGPQTVDIAGQSKEITSTYAVTLQDNLDNFAYLFNEFGVGNPDIKLFRGQTYRFEINTPGYPFSIAIFNTFKPGEEPIFNDENLLIGWSESENVSTLYDKGVTRKQVDADGVETDADYVERGYIEFTIPNDAPDKLFYISKNNPDTAGAFDILDIDENTFIDVEAEIVGKKSYTTADGWELSNGMKVQFVGEVTPEKYASEEWYVEGVGISIKLVNEKDLAIPAEYTENVLVPFDTEKFDRVPFSDARGFAGIKDYIIINRASQDRNPWSRYNHWFHQDVIQKSAEINGTTTDLNQDFRAKRPIIEFESGLKLYNFGTQSKQDIDIIDFNITDVFSNVEGQRGYYVDGVQLTQGMRVLFAGDSDSLVKNKIYQVNFIRSDDTGPELQIYLKETDDAEPQLNETVFVTNGISNRGKIFYYNGTDWILAQQKTVINQPPMFDIFDAEGYSYSDETQYPATTFAGNKIFSYAVGSGTNDSELGFPLTYRSLENSGDIVFDFNLTKECCVYETDDTRNELFASTGYLRIYNNLTNFSTVNGWTKAENKSTQYVIRQYDVTESTQDFAIDVYDNSSQLEDIRIIVYKNDVMIKNTDYEVINLAEFKTVRFNTVCVPGDVVILKTSSAAKKNDIGFYEIPYSLERNPRNMDLSQFTFGEVNNHVDTMIEDLFDFDGNYPGISNLRDLGNIGVYGKRFLQHSSPFNIPLYHLTNENVNVVKAVRYAKNEYATFKRVFLQTAKDLGFLANPRQHVDEILKAINQEKSNTMPFYFSDMLGYGQAQVLTYEVFDSDETFFAIRQPHNLTSLSPRAVYVYLNEVQLTHGKDYTFTDEGFVNITAEKNTGDTVEIVDYETTDGSYIPPTPSKLGLFPAYVPTKFVDNTYQTQDSVEVIQGHDGSITVAYGDYRDDVLLELENRIYNNIKSNYENTLVDIYNFIPGEFRNTGIDKESIDRAMLKDFHDWLQLVGTPDFTDIDFYDITNQFSYNYTNMKSPSGKDLSGFWRSVYKFAFDTDRPHTHPWEMLGFSIQPDWWTEVYGPAPYTAGNLILWQDLENGAIREPGKALRYLDNFKRPRLTTHIPVSDMGELLAPFECGFAQEYIESLARQSFVFGDEAPTETAWRRSSEYPFALTIARLLNQSCEIFSKGFDTSRQIRNIAGNIVYKDTNKAINTSSLSIPNIISSSDRVQASGLINYIVDYVVYDKDVKYEQYIDDLQRINNQLSVRVGGFTDKEKFKLILDSRTPFNKGNVFVPEENYQVFFNTSTPINLQSYSGIIIEKLTRGFRVSGYDFSNPKFNYLKPFVQDADPVINVGGVSESFVFWRADNFYSKGTLVQHENRYYRTAVSHTSGDLFDIDKFSTVPRLPLVGGRSTPVRQKFESRPTEISYGTVFETVTEVSDFIQGYAKYLTDQGFKFDFYNLDFELIENWRISLNEFLFWTTQNWNAGTVITLSPAANQLIFENDVAVVDNVTSDFYEYSLRRADGKPLRPEFKNIFRQGNEFTISPKNTTQGLYHIKLPLVQKEHVVLLDNETVFNDVIYDPVPGYRQERIKVIGYRSTDWNGGFEIPGFVYDDVTVTDWQPWRDYNISQVVRYKEFYYIAQKNIPGTADFESESWARLDEKPEKQLLTNFEYKINQFKDFYDLDTDNFDTEQQRFAQHLIGYQKREYLQNIINDEVSQYKFYQGFIQDKGTRNSLNKLFDALNSADEDSLEFYEEWAIRLGVYGAVNKFEEVEYLLDESKFRLAPQPFELVNTLPTTGLTDLVYRIIPSEVYLKPEEYNHSPFPEFETPYYAINNSGYVREEDVRYRVLDTDEILNIDITAINNGDYIWVVNDQTSWKVIKAVDTDARILSVDQVAGELVIELDKDVRYTSGDIIGLSQLESNNGFFKVIRSSVNKIFCEVNQNIAFELVENQDGNLIEFQNVRIDDYSKIDLLFNGNVTPGDKIWVDNAGENLWAVLENTPRFSEIQSIKSNIEFDSAYEGFAESIAISKNNLNLAIGIPYNSRKTGDSTQIISTNVGKVQIQLRNTETGNFVARQEFTPDENLADIAEAYGYSIDISEDGRFLVVGAPNATDIKTRYQGVYSEASNYSKNDIVKYNEQFWTANKDIVAANTATPFETFTAHNFLYEPDYDSTLADILVTGFPGFATTVDHLLIRAPVQAYTGTSAGDTLFLKYNFYTYDLNGNLAYRDPFGAQISGIDSDTLTGEFQIVDKVDRIIQVDSYINLPAIGSEIFTDTGRATVVDLFSTDISVIMYLKNINGIFDFTGTVTTEVGAEIGTYQDVYLNENNSFGGYWYINVNEYTTDTVFTDVANGLIIQDIIQEGVDEDPAFYLNILDTEYTNRNLPNNSDRVSFITKLGYNGNPGSGAFLDYPSSLWAMRLPRDYTDDLTNGSVFTTFFSQRFFGSSNESFSDYGFDLSILNKEQTVFDLWDGFIEYTIDNFGLDGEPFEPAVGDIIRDIQIPFEADGSISTTQSSTTSEAEVLFYQRQGTRARIYINKTSGNFDILDNTARFRLERIANTVLRPGDVDRIMGSVSDYDNNVVLDSVANNIGKLVIIQEAENLPITEDSDIFNSEYWIYSKENLTGPTTEASIPGVFNLDWTRTNQIPATEFGTSNQLINQGYVEIFEIDRARFYNKVVTLVSPDFIEFEEFGNKVKITKDNDLYTLFVSAAGNSTADNSGKIHVIKFGTEDGVEYNWEYAKDKLFKGAFEAGESYRTGDVVINDSVLYRASTNITSETFNTSVWQEVTDGLDYLGYLPNKSNTAYLDEEVYDPVNNIRRFGIDFDVDDKGNILVISTDEFGSPSPESLRKVLIYRKIDRKFFLDQVIDADGSETGFGDNVSISADGSLILISKPYNNSQPGNKGEVLIYERTVINQLTGETEYRLKQQLTSPLDEPADSFGYQADFLDNNTVVVSAISGDKIQNTTFDVYTNLLENSNTLFATPLVNDPASPVNDSSTTFDNKFTTFSSTRANTGAIYTFEQIGESYIFAENVESESVRRNSFFGQAIQTTNNHIYAGMPWLGQTDEYQGTLIDLRKAPGTTAWTRLRQPVPTADLSKIKTAFLYNTRTQELITYLDIIDPLQNKFAGIAEQEIDFKTYYDPALYNVGPASEIVNQENHWAENYVGKIWFDLSSIKVIDAYQGDSVYQANNWNQVIPRTTPSVFEWVETKLSPEQWDELTGTEEGFAQGVTGTTRYGNSLYSVKREYNPVSQTFSNVYYYWVANKTTVPNVSTRSLDAASVASAIAFPRETGLRFLALLSKNKFALYNCDSLISGKDVALHVSYYVTDDIEQNMHKDYQIISEGLSTSVPNLDIEKKWVDSLVGFDEQYRPVPDPNLSTKEKYGTLFNPRQSWFVNKNEALKQVIERVNSIILNEILIDSYNLTPLFEKDPLPLSVDKEFDETIGAFSELKFVGTARLQQAKLEATVRDGVITAVQIVSPGRGYKTAPKITVTGNGSGAEITCTINNLGNIVSVSVDKGGFGYTQDVQLIVRPYTVLVEADENIQNRWSLYVWSSATSEWSRIRTQSYDVSRYWNYVDWYASGYSQYSKIDFTIDATYKLPTLNDSIGDIIKIETVDSGGWLLLEKINNLNIPEFTVNYRTIGRQDGTVQFTRALYDFTNNAIGFDNFSYDSQFYDRQPVDEIRIIMDFIKNNLFIGDLASEYNKLFFSSLRYVFSEQPFVDWAFKTSFVKAKHNLGQLEQKVNFNNDNLPSYQEYIEEAKPYKTQIREYISSYKRLENTNTTTTDFDLPSYYDENQGRIVNPELTVKDSELIGVTTFYQTSPYSEFIQAAGFEIKEILISNRGSGYVQAPVITLQGGGGTGARATAYLSSGRISNIEVTNPGSGYLTAPEVVIEGSIREGGNPAIATAVLGNSRVRSSQIQIKFDRISGQYYITNTQRFESFTGTGSRVSYQLRWPMDLKKANITIEVDGEELLRSEYTYANIIDEDKGLVGRIEFTNPPPNNSFVSITYNVNAGYLSAEDRIYQYYNPTTGMIGKELNQLMTGIDYGGVEVRSFQFSGLTGWDVDAWYTSIWDAYDDTFEDEIFTLDGSTTILELATPFESGVQYNVYRNGVRLDDPNFGTATPITNPNAETQSITGDGVTTLFDMIDAGIDFQDGDVIIIRKSTSDGSFLPEPITFDTQLEGGDLQYNTATGINAEDIIVDGDGFVTPTTSGKTEELVPGQVLDTLDLQVYHREGAGSSNITSVNYITDGITGEYSVDSQIYNTESVLVNLNNTLLSTDDYAVNFEQRTITLSVIPTAGSNLNIINLGKNGSNILELTTVILDTDSDEVITGIKNNIVESSYVAINGIRSDAVIEETTDNFAVIKLPQVLPSGTIVTYGLFYSEVKSFSEVTKDNFVGDGSTIQFELSQTPFTSQPLRHNVLVRVDNRILNAGYNKQFVISEARERTLQIDTWQQPSSFLDSNNIEVYLNGIQIELTVSWRLDIFNAAIILFDNVGVPGDLIEVYITSDSEYTLEEKTLTINSAPSDDAVIEVYQFSNHDILGIERFKFDNVARSTLIPETDDYFTFNKLNNGLIKLREPAIDAEYVWVTVDGELLIPSVDYSITDNRQFVKLLSQPAENAVIEVIHFTSSRFSEGFAYRQFKDILNRTHYKKIDNSKTAVLTQDLNYYDLTIEVDDASNLSEPNRSKNIPGVIFVNGERIEYLIKQGNVLRQLRRGTLGTGINQIIPVGAQVFDQGPQLTIPYKDEFYSQIFTVQEDTTALVLDFVPSSENEIEVFVGGRRLKKLASPVYNPYLDQRSPEGDQDPFAAEFFVSNNVLQLNVFPQIGEKIVVLRKLGKAWTENNESLAISQSTIGKFLRT